MLRQLWWRGSKHEEPLLSAGEEDWGRREGLALMGAVGPGQEGRLGSDGGCRTGVEGKVLL